MDDMGAIWDFSMEKRKLKWLNVKGHRFKYAENLKSKRNQTVQITFLQTKIYLGWYIKWADISNQRLGIIFAENVPEPHQVSCLFFSWRSHERNPLFPVILNRPPHLFPKVTHESSTFCEHSFIQGTCCSGKKKKTLKNKHTPARCLGLNWEYLARIPNISSNRLTCVKLASSGLRRLPGVCHSSMQTLCSEAHKQVWMAVRWV